MIGRRGLCSVVTICVYRSTKTRNDTPCPVFWSSLECGGRPTRVVCKSVSDRSRIEPCTGPTGRRSLLWLCRCWCGCAAADGSCLALSSDICLTKSVMARHVYHVPLLVISGFDSTVSVVEDLLTYVRTYLLTYLRTYPMEQIPPLRN